MMYKLLIIIGALEDDDLVKSVVKSVITGMCKWMEPLPLHELESLSDVMEAMSEKKTVPNRDADSGLVVSRFGIQPMKTTILINPTLPNLHNELIDFATPLDSDCSYLIAFGGLSSEGEGDWILQDGLFSLNDLISALHEPKVASTKDKFKVAVSCCKFGQWNMEDMNGVEQHIKMEIIDSSLQEDGVNIHSKLAEDKIDKFASFLEDSVANEVDTVFQLLKPPTREGFMKTHRPCIYIFPGGAGDSAFFAINGFNMLVNGGSTYKPGFWSVIRHLDRLDSIIATHLGADNLPGINSLLVRKVQERMIRLPVDALSDEYQQMRRCLISPDLGPMFFNAPARLFESLKKSSPKKIDDNSGAHDGPTDLFVRKLDDIVEDTLRMAKALNLDVLPIRRKPDSNEPINLFSKLGCGKLDMYVLNPVEGARELNYMDEKWGVNGHANVPAGKNGCFGPSGAEEKSSYADLCSVAVLVVWHPSDPDEKIVRVLFPGNTSQAKIFEGLNGIKQLPFMKMQHATAGNTAPKEPKKAETFQKPARPGTAAAKTVTQKKLASTLSKKSGFGSTGSLVREPTSRPAKVLEKRAKADKPAAAKLKNGAGKAAAPLKERASSAKPAKSTTASATAKSVASPTAKRAQSSKSSKPESKRPAAAGRAVATSKAKPTDKATDKAKKPASAVQKARPEAAKTSVKKSSPRQAPKKNQASPVAVKTAKKTKPALSSLAVAGEPAADKSVVDKAVAGEPVAAKAMADKDMSGEPVACVTTEAEEPMTAGHEPADPAQAAAAEAEEDQTELPQRRSPEGGSGIAVQCTAWPPVVEGDGNGLDSESLPQKLEEAPVQEAENLEERFLEMTAPQEDERPVEDDEIVTAVEERPQDVDILAAGNSAGDAPAVDVVKAECAADVSLDMIAEPDILQTIPGELENVQICDKSEAKDDISPSKEGDRDAHSSANSSVEGCYVLHPESKSPPVASAQETMADTISEFKLDEWTTAETEPDTEANSCRQPTEAAEDETASTESGAARADPPDSSYEMRHSAADAQQHEMELETIPSCVLGSYRTEDDISSLSVALTNGERSFDEFKSSPSHLIASRDALADVSKEQTETENASECPEMLSPARGSPIKHFDNGLPVDCRDAEITSDLVAGTKIANEMLAKIEIDDDGGADTEITDQMLAKAEIDDDMVTNSELVNKLMDETEIANTKPSGTDNEEEILSNNATTWDCEFRHEDDNEFGLKSDEGVWQPQCGDLEMETADAYPGEDIEYADRSDDESSEEHDTNTVGIAMVESATLEAARMDDEMKYGSTMFANDELLRSEGERLHSDTNRYDADVEDGAEVSDRAVQDENRNHDQMSDSDNEFDNRDCVLTMKELHHDAEKDEVSEEGSVDSCVLKEGYYRNADDDDQDAADTGLGIDDMSSKNGEFGLHASQLEETEVPESGMRQGGQVEGQVPPPSVERAESDCFVPVVAEDEPLVKDSEVLPDAVQTSEMSEDMNQACATGAGSIANTDGFEPLSTYHESLNVETTEREANRTFALHAGDETEQEKSAPMPALERPDRGLLELDGLGSGDAPIADATELDIEFARSERGQFDSPLDANAKPFLPKSAVGSGCDQGGGASENKLVDGDLTAPFQPTNPFLKDIIAEAESAAIDAEDQSLPPARGPDPCAGPEKPGRSTIKKTTQTRKAPAPVYVDMAYIPNHGNKGSVGPEFFKRIRARYYVLSGSKQSCDEPSAEVLEHLLEGRKSWLTEAGAAGDAGDSRQDSNVTVIPTHDTPSIQEWYKKNFKDLEAYNINIVASGCQVVMQTESIAACKIEF